MCGFGVWELSPMHICEGSALETILFQKFIFYIFVLFLSDDAIRGALKYEMPSCSEDERLDWSDDSNFDPDYEDNVAPEPPSSEGSDMVAVLDENEI